MPIKLGKSYKNIDRQTKKVTTHHPYIRGFSKADLIEKYNADNTRTKDKQKIKSIERGESYISHIPSIQIRKYIKKNCVSYHYL